MIQVFLIALFSTFFGSLCGGGSSLISTPLLISMGFPVPMCLALIKSNSAMWTMAASRNYLKKHPANFRFLFTIAIVGVPFVYLGTFIARWLSPEDAKQVIGIFIVTVSIILAFKHKLKFSSIDKPVSNFQTTLSVVPLAVYEGFYGAGMNVIAAVLLGRGRQVSIHEALGWYYSIAIPWCILAAIVYFFQSSTPLELLLATLIGAILGGHFGSAAALKLPSDKLKYLVICFGILSGARLILSN